MSAGPLALVGGDEFRPGNEATDRRLVAAARGGPAFVVPTAAARQHPAAAVATARQWFAGLGLDIVELPVLKRGDALSDSLAARAAEGRFFYLTGGDPGLVIDVLRDTPVWAAIVAAWRGGAALAGSSAGAMALGQWTLLRDRWPNPQRRRTAPALGIVPGVAVVPHFDTAGRRWTLERAEGSIVLGIDERTAAIWESGAWHASGPGRVAVDGDENAVGRLPQPLVASADS